MSSMHTGAERWRGGHVLHVHRCGEVERGACPPCTQVRGG